MKNRPEEGTLWRREAGVEGCSGSAQERQSCKISPVGVSIGSHTDGALETQLKLNVGCWMIMEELGPLWPFGVCSSINSQLRVRC